jgi:hypothetical protein
MSSIDSTRFIGADAVRDEDLRLDNADYLRGRNAADSADVQILRVNSSNEIEVSNGTATNIIAPSLSLKDGATAPTLRLYDDNNSNYIGLKAPGTVASNLTFTVPSVDGVAHNVLTTNGSGAFVFKMFLDPRDNMFYFEDFLAGGTSTASFNNTSTGTGASISNSGSNIAGNAWGMLGVATGTTTTGRGSGRGGVLNLGDANAGYTVCMQRVKVNTLSTVTDEYLLEVGIHDATNVSTAPTEGVWFSYDRLTSTNWIINNAAASTTTSTTTSTAVSTNFVTLMWVANAAWTSIEYFIDGVSVGTHTTNIPNGGTNVNPTMRMIKSAGTTSITNIMDYFYFLSSIVR